MIPARNHQRQRYGILHVASFQEKMACIDAMRRKAPRCVLGSAAQRMFRKHTFTHAVCLETIAIDWMQNSGIRRENLDRGFAHLVALGTLRSVALS